jgi:hypothetical protein
MADLNQGLAQMGGNFYIGMQKLAVSGAWIIGLVIVAVIAMYLLKFKKKVTLIFETAGGGKRKVLDRGFFNIKKNEFKLLKNKNVECPVPESEHEYISGRNTEYIGTVRNNTVSWLTISANPHFIPANYDMQEKLALKIANVWSIFQPKQGFWDKYGASILWVGSMGVFLIVIILILKRMDAIIAMGNSVAQAQIAANKQVIESLPILGLMSVRKKDGA